MNPNAFATAISRVDVLWGLAGTLIRLLSGIQFGIDLQPGMKNQIVGIVEMNSATDFACQCFV